MMTIIESGSYFRSYFQDPIQDPIFINIYECDFHRKEIFFVMHIVMHHFIFCSSSNLGTARRLEQIHIVENVHSNHSILVHSMNLF